MRKILNRLWRDEQAATAVEYAVMLGLILMACIASIGVLGIASRASWENTSNSISTAMGS